jgi:hypothetical protein
VDEQSNEEQQGAAGEPDLRARLQEKLKDLEAKLREKVKDVDETVRAEFRDAIPSHVSEHLAKSKEEFLLAVRGIVDRQIEKARRSSAAPPDSTEDSKSEPPPPQSGNIG